MARFVLALALLFVALNLSEAGHRDAEQGTLQHHRNKTKQYQLIISGNNKNGLENFNLVCSKSEQLLLGSIERKTVFKFAESTNGQVSVHLSLTELVVETSPVSDNAKRDN